jgi:hypothetical protein
MEDEIQIPDGQQKKNCGIASCKMQVRWTIATNHLRIFPVKTFKYLEISSGKLPKGFGTLKAMQPVC